MHSPCVEAFGFALLQTQRKWIRSKDFNTTMNETINVHTYICVYIYTYHQKYLYLYTHLSLQISVGIHMCVYVCVHVSLSLCTYIYINTYTDRYANTQFLRPSTPILHLALPSSRWVAAHQELKPFIPDFIPALGEATTLLKTDGIACRQLRVPRFRAPLDYPQHPKYLQKEALQFQSPVM